MSTLNAPTDLQGSIQGTTANISWTPGTDTGVDVELYRIELSYDNFQTVFGGISSLVTSTTINNIDITKTTLYVIIRAENQSLDIYSEYSSTLEIPIPKNTVISVNFVNPKIYGEPPFNVNATSNNPSTFTYSSNDNSVATIDSNGLVNILKPGTTTLTISQIQSGIYLNGSLSQNLVINESTSSNPVICNTPDEFLLAVSLGAQFITVQNDIILDTNDQLLNQGDNYQVITNSSSSLITFIKTT
jgi:hypothetical protein